MKNKIIFTLFLGALLSLVSCNEGGGVSEVTDKLDQAYNPTIPAYGSVKNGACYEDQYATSEQFITRKMDIIIVPDTSTSLKEERTAIAEGFDAFLNSIPNEVDYRIGVVLAHSGKSPKSGKLFQRDDEPFVLDSQQQSLTDIKAGLIAKLKSPAGDGFSDGGEMGMYSILKAMQPENLQAIKDQGLFREDAALVVIFVADENDVCGVYPEGVNPVVDPQKQEKKSYDLYCADSNGNLLVTADMVVDGLRSINPNMPVVIGGVLYNNSATMPMVGENELGYGYLDVIAKAGGISVDLANGDYGDGLSRIGNLATISVDAQTQFALKADTIVLNSLEVLVDGSAAHYSYDDELNAITLLDARDPFSVVNIKYCEQQNAPKQVAKVMSGGAHNCAILINGDVKCWGSNTHGQLGIENTENIGDNESVASVPTVNLNGAKVIDLALGLRHTCALLENGNVKCWGDNGFGQLGQGNTEVYGDNAGESPGDLAAIPLASKASKIYAGTYYNCAILDNAKVQCWGQNNFGQLGYGHTNNLGDNESLAGLGYVNLGGNVIQMDLSTISFHSCAVIANGSLRCWGLNNQGQLGIGSSELAIGDNELPISVAALNFSDQVLQLTTGGQHTCAIVGGQKFRCWGYNGEGQVGIGDVSIKIGSTGSPTADDSNLFDLGGKQFLMVSAGNKHNCALTSNSKVYCWGLSSSGQTGLGHMNNIGDDEVLDANNTKALLNIDVSYISGGTNHNCAVTKDDGKVICWGANESGQLGLGHTNTIGDDEMITEVISMFDIE